MRSKGLAAFLLLAGLAGSAAHAASVPVLESRGGDSLSDSDRSILASWALAQPEVKAHVGADRLRFLRGGAEVAKRNQDQGGGEYRRALLFYRNYDRGLVHEVEVDLDAGTIGIRDLFDSVQPTREEVAAAVDVIRKDPVLGVLVDDPAIHVDGGFYERAQIERDPCAKDICLIVELMNAGVGNGWASRVIVNLSKGTVANRDFHGPTVEGQIVPLSDLGAH
jgi:hypothetical protein